MSTIHGNQYVLCLFLDKSTRRPLFEECDELATAFHLLTRDFDLNGGQNVLSFSKLLWPFLAIQGTSKPYSTHIILDGVKVFSKKSKFTNPPRKPLLGHVLRNTDERGEIELLNRIREILTYQDSEAEEVGEGMISEYQVFEVPSLINPEFLESLKVLLPYLEFKSLDGSIPLDASLTTEEALDISEEYRNTIQKLKGNASRWKEQIDLVGNALDSILKDIKVKIMNIERRYNAEIDKVSNSIDENRVKKEIESKKDNTNIWKRQEKKKLIENVASLFKTLNRNLEDIHKKNKFYSNSETLLRSSFNELIPKIGSQFDTLRKEVQQFLGQIDSIETKFKSLKTKSEEIDDEARKKINEFQQGLTQQLDSRDQQISKIEQEKKEKIEELEALRAKMDALFSEIKEIINSKRQDCLKEAEDLMSWSIKDEEAPTIKKPIQWIYMPLYVMFVEDIDMLEEKMEIILPGFIEKESKEVYEELPGAFSGLKEYITEKVEDDMALRSNFEFTAENNNFLKDPQFKEKLKKGVSMLENQGFIYEIERGIDKNIDKV